MKVFSWRTRVYWEDTDAGGVVYYANYLRYMERARTEWLRNLGYCQRDLASRHGVMFAVAKVRIDYRRPARLDDELSVTCEPRTVGAASVSFAQNISRLSVATSSAEPEVPGVFDAAPGVLTEAEVRIACLDARTFRPLRMPEFLLSAFAAQEKL
ncbi:MAG TPA: YbgC/FadM family acyl-CoA thioesterase [Steroidobacteraceae bacterium]|nr:YbgC/FadM family acyl-CoA thioesterase [Steroidobacteraceae bacterium]